MLTNPPLTRDEALRLYEVITKQENTRYADLPTGQIQPVLNGFNNRYYADMPCGWFPIKTVCNGQATYELGDGRRIAIDDGRYLILNDAQPYTIEIDSPTIVETFCVFFPLHWRQTSGERTVRRWSHCSISQRLARYLSTSSSALTAMTI
jgi:hypothetical protein